MADGADVDCLEFVTTWVRSGQYLSVDKTALPPEVRLAEPVAGLHLIHSISGATAPEMTAQALLAQPLGVLARAVDAPPMSVAADLDLDAAITRADALRLPVRVPGNTLAGSTSDRVLPIDAHGIPAEPATAEYVLVLPATHLVAEHSAAELGHDLGRIVPGPPMPGQVRLAGDRVELGLPLPIVDARFAGIDLTEVAAGEFRTVEGGIKGLWRDLANLAVGHATRVRVTQAGIDAPEDLLAVRSPDGVALLRDTPTGAQAATLPRHPATIEVGPAIVSAELDAAAVLREPFAGAVPAVHPDVTAAAVYLAGRGGLLLLDPDQTAQIDAAQNFRADSTEYPVFVHGTPAGPVVGGRLVTAEQLRDLIAADPLSRGRTIILVQCDAASSTTIVDDFAAALFAALPREYPRIVAMGGTAWVQPRPVESDELTEVLVTSTDLTPDGQFRLVAGGIRTYTGADALATTTPARVPVVTQHGPALSRTRGGDGVRLTDASGAVLTGDEAPTTETVRELTGIGTAVDSTAVGVPFSYTFAQAYQGVEVARTAAANAAEAIVTWATQAGDRALAHAGMLFHAADALQHSDPAKMSANVFERLRADDIERVRADLVQRAKSARDGLWTRTRELNDAAGQARHVVAHIGRDLNQRVRLPGLRPHVHPQHLPTFDQIIQYLHLSAQGHYRTPQESGVLNSLLAHFRGPQGALTALTTILHELDTRLTTQATQVMASATNLETQIAAVEAGLAWERAWLDTSHGVAEGVIRRVREKLSYGPANNDEIIARYNDGAVALVHHVRAPVYRKIPNDTDPLRFQSTKAFMAAYFRTGLCDEHAAVALAELFARPDMVGVPITLVYGNVVDRGQLRAHVFLVLGPLGHPNALVVDPWPLYPTAVRAGRYIAEMNAVTRAYTFVTDTPRDLYAYGREQVHAHLLPRLRHPVLQPVPIPVLAPDPESFDTHYTDRYAERARARRYAATVAPSGVHASPQDVAVYLPGDQPGLYLLGRDQQHLIDAAREFRAGDNEYPVFIDGTAAGPVIDGQLITDEQLRDLIVADPNSAGRDIVAVICDLAVTRAGATALDDFATRLFTLLPAGNRRVLAAGGVAQVVPGIASDLTEVVISPTVLGDDGRFRLVSGGFREIRDASADGQVSGRTPMVVQHGPRLSRARVETGVALTADDGNLLTGADLPAVTDLTALGLPDPARIQRLFDSADRQAATATEQPVMPTEAVGPPTWRLRLAHGVTEHGDVHVISSNSRHAPQRLINQLAEAADAEHPVILLGAPGPGEAALAKDVAALNNLLEQFAQREQLPVVVSRGRADLDLLDVVARYGATVLHPTLNKTDGSGLGGLQVDHRWKVATRLREGGSENSSDIWERITAGVLDAAARLARPTEAVTRVDDALGELIWAPDLTVSREVFHRLEEQWSAERMTAARTQVEKMIERVPGQPELGIFAPVLELGAVGQADIVFDYAGADEALRPKVLLDSVGRLETTGQLNMPVDGGLTTERLGAMVEAVGVTDISVSVLTVLGDIKAGEFENAQSFIAANRGKLTVEQKKQWVDAITGLQPAMKNHTDELRLLSAGVLNC
ncbi:hypothetical protein [Micromonospora sp. NPDC005174]|uniref:hypothetical protein n=1 Tax=Micromonospora sp. NPDC005174 TaxID=3157018 RepID=UPI0033A65983